MMTSYTKLQCTGYKRLRDKALDCHTRIKRPLLLRPYSRYSMCNIRFYKFQIVPHKIFLLWSRQYNKIVLSVQV